MGKKIGFLLVGIVLVTLFTITCIPSSAAAEPIKLNFASFGPVKSFPNVQMERWKSEVEKRTGGKVSIKTFPAETLLAAKAIYDGVAAGQANIGSLCMAYQPGRFIVTNATSLPVGLPDTRVASLTLWDLYNKYKPKEFAEVKVLTMFTCPLSNIISKKAVRKLEDLKGLDLRASGGAAQILKAWGANPVGMPMPATVEALQKGVVQGLFSSLETLKDLKFAEYCPYVTMTDTVIYPFSNVMNMDTWNSLPKDVQKVIDDMGREHSEWVGKYNDDYWKKCVEWAKKNHNTEIITLSDQEKARWDKLVEPIINQWIEDANAKGFPGKAIVDDIRAFAKKNAK
ncbi:MAG: TRAP transporter substrate-binding protein [Pseudomonadota bacterium]